MCEETSEIYDYTFVITQDQLLHTLRPTGRFFPNSTSQVSLLIVRSSSLIQWINRPWSCELLFVWSWRIFFIGHGPWGHLTAYTCQLSRLRVENFDLTPAHAYGPISHAWLKNVSCCRLAWHNFQKYVNSDPCKERKPCVNE